MTMSTPEERLKIWREEQEAKTAAGRRRIWERERQPARRPAPQAPPRHGTLKNLALGAEQTIYGELVPSAITGLEALGAAMTGDFGPAKGIGGQALRAFGHLLTYDPAGTGISPGPGAARANAEAIARIGAERQAARQGDPMYGAVERVRQEVEAEAAQDPSRRGRIERGVGRFATAAAPAVLTGIATGGSVPAMSIASALQTLNAPENIPLAAGLGALPVPAGKFVAPILRRIRGARGAAAEAEAAGTAVAREAASVNPQSAIRNPQSALESALQKLETDNIEQIGAIIANSNRRLQKKITPEQRISAWEDYARLRQLTPDEHRALSQVLPARSYEPVGIYEKGGYSREIRDIPADQPNAQLDANLRELEAFFTAEGKAPPAGGRIFGQMANMARTPTSPVLLSDLRAQFPNLTKQQFDDEILNLAKEGKIAVHRHDYPGSLSEAELNALVKEGDNYFVAASFREPPFSATVSGPRTQSAALELKAARNPELVTKAERTPFLETLSALRKAGLLRITSHIKNIGGTGPWQVQDELARIPGAILDIVLSPFTKRRTYTGPSLTRFSRSAYEAGTKGIAQAKQILRNGATAEDIKRLGLHREINSGSKIIDWYVNGTFRLLGAEDRIFRVMAASNSLQDRVRALALTEIRQGKIPRSQLRERFNELMKAPPEDVAAGAVLDADVLTFVNQNLVGTGLSAAKGALANAPGGRVANFAIDNVVPFVNTPTNVITAILESSPLGYGKNAAQLAKAIVKKSFTPEQQRQFVQTFGRATAGSGLVALGYVGYRDGWLTGIQEDEGSRRARDVAAGRIPGAILVGGEWHSLVGLAPWGSLVVIGASLAREAEQEQMKAKEEGRETSKARAVVTTAPEVFGRTILEQPLLSGTKQFIEGLEQPGTFGAKALGGIVGSYVPGHLSDVGQLIDYGVQREAQTLPQRVMARIPGVRQTLPERQDVLGRPMEASFPFNPARSQTAQQTGNPLFAELVRHDIGISGFEKKPNETDEQLRQRKTEFGRLYIPFGIQLVSSPQYQRATAEIQQGAIKKLNERAKELVEKKRQRAAPGLLSPGALIGAAIGSQARERAKKKSGQ